MVTFMHISWFIIKQFQEAVNLRGKFLGDRLQVLSTQLDNIELFPKIVLPIYISTYSVFSTTPGFVQFSLYNNLCVYEILSHLQCHEICISLVINETKYFQKQIFCFFNPLDLKSFDFSLVSHPFKGTFLSDIDIILQQKLHM